MSRLEVGKHWVKRTLEELSRGRSVQMWWWERTGPSELTLFLAGGDERGPVSLRLRERVLRACAEDPETRAEVTPRLIAAIEQIDANPSEPKGL